MTVGEALSQFPRDGTWLLPALQAAQHAEGWLSPETLASVAAHLRVPKSEVWGVASHYPELRLVKPGRRLVRVCTGVACVARGASELLERCERRLAVRAGETTRDGAVTLEAMDCAFACSVAPVIEADHTYRGRITPVGRGRRRSPSPTFGGGPPPPGPPRAGARAGPRRGPRRAPRPRRPARDPADLGLARSAFHGIPARSGAPAHWGAAGRGCRHVR